VDRSRLEAFSDGVFAVAITLLALNLYVATPGPVPLAAQLGSHWPSFVAYLISFLTIGIIWVNHHALIKSIKSVDRTLLFVNQLLLLFVVLIPWSTATVTAYLHHDNWDARVAMAIYAGVFLGMSLGFGAIFEWTLHGDRVYQPVPPERRWAARIRFVGGSSVYVVAIVVALFNAYAAFALTGLIAVYYITERTPTSPASPASPDSPDGSPLVG
jgi:TMEM175 potassium channel family protein